MTGTLVRKEIDQHWRAFVLLALLTFASMILITLTMNRQGTSGSVFMGLLTVLWMILPLSVLVLTQRLVAIEFREKTQLFLEALPVPRWWMIAVKYAIGLAVALALALGSLALACLLGKHNELLTPRFLSILATRTAVWTWFVFGLIFVTGFLGRYRLAFYLIVGAGYGLCEHYTDFRAADLGPFAIVDMRFPFENTLFPIAALKTTLLFCLAFVALTFVIGLAREGTVAAMLGEKMSHREKMFIGTVAIGCFIAFAAFEERKTRDPYDLPGATEEGRGDVVVKVAADTDIASRQAGVLAARAADELAALRDYLGLETMPAVFIVLRTDFGAKQFEHVILEETEDVVLRANFTAPEFEQRAFLNWVVREVLVARSRKRLELERKRWVLDGFVAFWDGRARAAEPMAAEKGLAGRAQRGVKKGFAQADLARWLSFCARAGDEDDANAVAWSGLKTLARRHGPDACRDFLRAVLSPHVAKDVRATWHDLRHPVASLLESAAGVRFETFFAEWREELAAAREPQPATEP